jgi:hypothetical protein
MEAARDSLSAAGKGDPEGCSLIEDRGISICGHGWQLLICGAIFRPAGPGPRPDFARMPAAKWLKIGLPVPMNHACQGNWGARKF